MITPPSVEPEASPWRRRLLSDLVTDLTRGASERTDRPLIIAVDGRQGSGKTTIADRLAALVPDSMIVHSDDVAWWESFFGWDGLMISSILEPLRRGAAVDYRPPAWDARGRHGSIVVPTTAPLVLIEGVGTSRHSIEPNLDAAIWVQSDFEEANRRGIAREGGGTAETDFWWEWDREERPFLAEDRPWERADVIICGTPELAGRVFDPGTEVVVGRSLRP